MSPSFQIRTAAAGDYDALCALWTELDEHHRAARPDLFRRPSVPSVSSGRSLRSRTWSWPPPSTAGASPGC